MPIVIVVDGIIGSGKSTIIKDCFIPKLTERGYRVTEVKEPVEKWKENGRLEQFYKDPKGRSYQFQTRAFHDRVTEAQEKYSLYKNSTDIFLLERSIFTDVLFAKMLNESGNMDDTELEDYLDLWKMWEKVMPFKPDLFIYLKPDLDVCQTRLKERNRQGEEGVSNEYQTLLEMKHDEFLGEESVKIIVEGKEKLVPRLLIKTNSNFRDNENIKEELCDLLLEKISNI